MNEQQGWMGLQVTLQKMGFDPGPIDGYPGPRTLSAALAAVQSIATKAVATNAKGPVVLLGAGLVGGFVIAKLLKKSKG